MKVGVDLKKFSFVVASILASQTIVTPPVAATIAENDKSNENNSEAFIQDTFISKHSFPQIWIDLESNVELKSTQLTEGSESDIYVQNRSTLHATNCIIRNDKFQFNVQAVNYSKITLEETIVDNYAGEKFYSENNSTITNLLDEVSD